MKYQNFKNLGKSLFNKLNKPANDIKLNSSLSEEFLQERAQEKIKAIKEDFAFKEVIIKSVDWYDVYNWVNDVYQALETAQKNMMLDKKAAGGDVLTLAFDPDASSAGAMYTVDSQTITFCKVCSMHRMCEIWQHEYMHHLDYSIQAHQDSSFMSHRIMESIATNEFDKKDRVSRYMGEMMALLYSGSRLDEMLASNQEKVKTSIEVNHLNLIKNLVGYAWGDDNLPEIKEMVNTIKDNIKSMNYRDEVNNEPHNNQGSLGQNEKINILMQPESLVLKNMIKNFYTNKAITDLQMTNAVKNCLDMIKRETGIDRPIEVTEKQQIRKYLKIIRIKSYDSVIAGFAANTKIAKNGLTSDFENKNLYWASPVEVIARASEEIQRPLIIGTLESNDNIITEHNRVHLNKSERQLLLATIHAMAEKLNLPILGHYKNAMCLEPILDQSIDYQGEDPQSYLSKSFATNDEKKTAIALKINEQRDKTYSSKSVEKNIS